MNNYHSALNIGIVTIAGSWLAIKISALIGGWDYYLNVLVGFMAIDYITGLMYAISIHNLASRKSLRGIRKKVGMLLLVFAGYWLDVVLGDPDSKVLRNLIIMMLIATEGISFGENLVKLGVPVPEVFIRMLDTFNVQKSREDKKDDKDQGHHQHHQP